MSRKQKKVLTRIVVSAILVVVLLLVKKLLPNNRLLVSSLFLIPYLVIGYDVVLGALSNVVHGRFFDEKFLMAIATIGAILLGEYFEAVGVMLFYQIGELFQSIAVGKSRKSIASLMDIRPEYAVVIRENEEIIVSPDEVEIGEIILVKAGEKIPLDGNVVEGDSSINTSALTGESVPLDVGIGDSVMSGSINISGVLKVKTSGVFADSAVSKILELVETSSSKKAKSEKFITKFSKIYTPFVVFSALFLAIVPPLINHNWSEWINRALIFLMVSCPCALVVSVPMSFFGGIGSASKCGILIKGSNYMEVLAKVKTVVFDKTGTLTKGVFKVSAVHSSVKSEKELLEIAATVESFSSHPVAKSIVTAHGKTIDKSRNGKVTEMAGLGLKVIIDEKTYYVGNSKLMEKIGVTWQNCHLNGTVVHLCEDREYLGYIIINDEVKPESKNAIFEMKSLGVEKAVMLTGDNKNVAEVVAKEIGIDEFHAELLPDKKVEQIEKLLRENKITAFVGDGINDAPSLTRADVGIAMGGLGSDCAIESADVVIMDDKLSKIPLAIKMARKTISIVKQNIFFAIFVKVLILILSAIGLTNMWMAIFGDVGVLILAVINALRSLKIKEKSEKIERSKVLLIK